MINILGFFVVGECDYFMYGGNCLGVNFLFFVIYGGMVVGLNVVKYVNGLEFLVEDMFLFLFDVYVKKEEEKWVEIMSMDGIENVYVFYKEFGEWMMVNVIVVCYNDKLLKMDDKIQELMEWFKKININDIIKWSNQGVMFICQFLNMFQFVRVIIFGVYN